MRPIGPFLRTAARYGVRYGPHAKQAWDLFGKQAQAAARDKAAELSARRHAFLHAETVRDGSVLRVIHDARPVWVVYSGDRPVHTYPTVAVAIDRLVADADVDKRVTPEEHRARRLRERAKRVRPVSRPRRGRRGSGELEGTSG